MIKNVIKKLLDGTQYISAIEKQNHLLQQKIRLSSYISPLKRKAPFTVIL